MPPSLNRKTGGPSQQVQVRMSPEMHQAVKDDADTNERTMAQTVRHAVRLYLESKNDG